MGCSQSSPDIPTSRHVMGVGQSERMVSRIERQKAAQVAKSGSSTTTVPSQSIEELHPPKLDDKGHLLPEEVVLRSSNSIVTKEINLGTAEYPVKVEFAHWTQRGYYPDDVHKENQDELSIVLQFAGEDNGAMFAVYDGHGKTGHECSTFAKKKLPAIIAKYVRQERAKNYQKKLKEEGSEKGVKVFDPQKWPLLTEDEYKECCRKAFLECNKLMHKSNAVDDRMSGTTAISAHFHGNLLAVCNVGDSRAVLGHWIDASSCDSNDEKKEEILAEGEVKTTKSKGKKFPSDGKILAIPLSRDQTPYRKDERERVKRYGAAIMSIDQMEGHEEMHENWGDIVLGEDVDIHGDPPRVWVEGKDYPGTAFTRSLGDSVSEEIGVTAEPEILARELTKNDHILVVASDGIFEFLTNQEVIDVCTKCESPLIACEKLVDMAYGQWRVYEKRTDDITIIVCFLTSDREPPEDGIEGTTEDLVALAHTIYGNKPVRKKPRGKNDNLSMSEYSEEAAAVALRAEMDGITDEIPERSKDRNNSIFGGDTSNLQKDLEQELNSE